jgi:hypothetical protein
MSIILGLRSSRSPPLALLSPVSGVHEGSRYEEASITPNRTPKQPLKNAVVSTAV